MSKNLLKAAAISAVMTSALVAGDCGIRSGAYAGISAGVSHLGGKNEYTITNPNDPAQVYNSKGKLSANSFAAGLFAGYGYKINAFWLAAELVYQFDNLSSNHDSLIGNAATPSIKLSSKTTGAFGGAFHVGFIANASAVAYAILGLESRSFKVKFADAVNHFDPALQTVKKNYRSTAFVPGLGVRFNLSKNLSLRTEYKCAMHRMKKFSKSATDTAAGMYAGGTTTVAVKHKPMTHSLMVGAAYTF